jgi:hypothetical protein
MSAQAVIVAAEVGPGHDGRAEVVVELAYPNGGRSRLSVSQEAAEAALDAAGLGSIEALRGQPWTVLVPDVDDLVGTGSLRP